VILAEASQKNQGDRAMETKEILLVDAKTPITSAIGFILQSRGYLVTLAPDAETAAAELDNYCFNLMLVYLTGHEKDKLALMRQAKQRSPRTKIMVVGNPRILPLPNEVFQTEMEDYMLTPFTASELCRRVERCLQKISTNHIKVRTMKSVRKCSNH